MIRLITGGESHGRCLSGILEGLPAGLAIDIPFVNLQLRRRQLGYGRGGRMKIERDEIDITAGVRHGQTIGSPIAFLVHNRDWSHWEVPMSVTPAPEGTNVRPVTRPRPGHADLAGALKYHTYDARNVLERASARETAARVAGGAFCMLFLRELGIRVAGHVTAVGDVEAAAPSALGFEDILAIDPESPLRCADPEAERRMKERIDEAKRMGDTLGGVLECAVSGLPPGLGSHTQWDRKLDGRIAQALMSIPAVKAVEIGDGIAGARLLGSVVHDEIFYDSSARRFYRKTNRAGGLEGGITNGSELRVRAFVKPIPTLRKPLLSVDLRSKEPFEAAFERSDTCVVPAAAVIVEAMLCLVLAGAFTEKFGGDAMSEVRANFETYLKSVRDY
jgi:chorismate synthase